MEASCLGLLVVFGWVLGGLRRLEEALYVWFERTREVLPSALAYMSGFFFWGGFGGTLAHILGDVFTYMRFRPLWPLSSREVGLGWFRAINERVNRFFAKLGSSCFTLVLVYRLVDWELLLRSFSGLV